MAPRYQSQVLDHLGLVAAMYEELEIGAVIDRAIAQDATKRTVSLGQAVKAMVLNGLGFVNQQLYLVPSFFPCSCLLSLVPPLSTGTVPMDPVYDNWERFCRYHVGDWHGIWTRYSCAGAALESFRCIRSFHVNTDASVLTHQNHYDYADGRRETKTFGPYTPSTTRSLFIDQSFSWGSPSAVVETPFFFETGFRWADRRMSCVVQYTVSDLWQPFLVIMEHLGLCRKFAFETICAMVSPGDLQCIERESNDGDQFQGGPFSAGYHSYGCALVCGVSLELSAYRRTDGGARGGGGSLYHPALGRQI